MTIATNAGEGAEAAQKAATGIAEFFQQLAEMFRRSKEMEGYREGMGGQKNGMSQQEVLLLMLNMLELQQKDPKAFLEALEKFRQSIGLGNKGQEVKQPAPNTNMAVARIAAPVAAAVARPGVIEAEVVEEKEQPKAPKAKEQKTAAPKAKQPEKQKDLNKKAVGKSIQRHKKKLAKEAAKMTRTRNAPKVEQQEQVVKAPQGMAEKDLHNRQAGRMGDRRKKTIDKLGAVKQREMELRAELERMRKLEKALNRRIDTYDSGIASHNRKAAWAELKSGVVGLARGAKDKFDVAREALNVAARRVYKPLGESLGSLLKAGFDRLRPGHYSRILTEARRNVVERRMKQNGTPGLN